VPLVQAAQAVRARTEVHLDDLASAEEFSDKTVMAGNQALSAELQAHLKELMTRVIREATDDASPNSLGSGVRNQEASAGGGTEQRQLRAEHASAGWIEKRPSIMTTGSSQTRQLHPMRWASSRAPLNQQSVLVGYSWARSSGSDAKTRSLLSRMAELQQRQQRIWIDDFCWRRAG